MESIQHEFFAGLFGIGMDARADHDRIQVNGQELHLKRDAGRFVSIIGDAHTAQIFIAGLVGNLVDVVVRSDQGFDSPGVGEREHGKG